MRSRQNIISRRSLLVGASGVLAALATGARAQSYPSGPVKIIIGVGPGSETRAPMAIATGAGMLSSTVLTLLVVPVFFLAFDDVAEWVKRGFRRKPEPPLALAATESQEVGDRRRTA